MKRALISVQYHFPNELLIKANNSSHLSKNYRFLMNGNQYFYTYTNFAV
jgi:hypothetical protein